MATNNAINAPLPISVTNGGTGLSTLTAHGILVGEGTSNITPITLTNGQLLIGSTGVDPVAALPIAGTGIAITPGAGTLTFSATGSMTWVDQSTASVTMLPNVGYVSDAGATLVTFTLPTTSALGDMIRVLGKGAGLYTIAQNAGQSIRFGNQVTTTGTGGSLSSELQYDCIDIICITANTLWTVVSAQGNITYV